MSKKIIVQCLIFLAAALVLFVDAVPSIEVGRAGPFHTVMPASCSSNTYSQYDSRRSDVERTSDAVQLLKRMLSNSFMDSSTSTVSYKSKKSIGRNNSRLYYKVA